ncbi:MAG: uncharacterized protein JWP01_3272 [Myxococcales bacterium]|nr:uncharacterized protein [Myxococcales bacterium]
MRTTSLLGFTVLSLAACGGGEAGPDADDGSVNCAVETTADTFVAPLDKMGTDGKLSFRLLSATPAPPARYDNEWTLQITQLANGVAGAPVTGATITVSPFMPKHGHGSPKDAVITELSTAGEYKLTPVYLSMPGLWETTINVTTASGSDSAIFRFCIPSG